MRGTIFDIKEFAVFDGPGIRTTVFLKGCPLRCRWCHNPEGLSPKRQLLVSHASCLHCGACEAACPKGIANAPDRAETCDACGVCVPVCPLNLRRMAGEEWEAGELAKRLLKGRRLLESNEGGVTFSGGEPMLQWPFVRSVIAQLDGLHTAIETSGYCADEPFREMLDAVDFVLMDLKLMDAAAHKHWTGADNAPILRHAGWLKESGKPCVFRVPLMPGVNDTAENLGRTAEFLRGARNLLRVELLPYHKTAGAKYGMLDMAYAPGFDVERAVRPALAPFAEAGIPVIVE